MQDAPWARYPAHIGHQMPLRDTLSPFPDIVKGPHRRDKGKLRPHRRDGLTRLTGVKA
jgi:hypothetical protein